jgi:hypothetical protein
MNSNSRLGPKRRLSLLILIGMVGICVVTDAQRIRTLLCGGKTPVAPVSMPSLKHFIGGFGIKSDAEIANAVTNGIQSTLIYGYTPDETNDSVGEALKANNMKVIDTMPWTYLYYYECHLDKTCPAATYPELTSSQAVLSDLTVHLKRMQSNSLVIAYWMLDDWPYKAGSGKDLLVQMNTLIHQYTPGKPTICGFGAEIPPLPGTILWSDSTAANFSPQGCDMVGLYIYAQSDSTGTYDWSMAHVFPDVFASLKKREWSILQEPLVGIPQVFGGTINGKVWPTPNASDIETQTKAYCQQGATGILYYSWEESGQSPMNNSQINQGIKSGIADCELIWK